MDWKIITPHEIDDILDYTKGEYWMRDSSGDSVNNMLERLKKAADGAALVRTQILL